MLVDWLSYLMTVQKTTLAVLICSMLYRSLSNQNIICLDIYMKVSLLTLTAPEVKKMNLQTVYIQIRQLITDIDFLVCP